MLIKHKKGIGLLELMLALALMAIVMLVTVRYYSNAKAKQEATTLVDSFSTLRSAAENYLANNPLVTPPTTNGINTLISQGYLPASFGSVSGNTVTVNKNTWGGTVSVNFPANTTQVQVVQTQIPAGVCNMALGQIQATLNTTAGESATPANSQGNASSCGSNGITTLTVNYNI